MKELFKLWDNEEKKVIEVEAKKVGSEWKARCPKHDDKVDSLSINKKKEVYNCFGCPFKGHLYNPATSPLHKPKKKVLPEKKPTINYKIMEKKAQEYLGNIPIGITESRGISDETIEKYQLGYCESHPIWPRHKNSITIPIYKDKKLVNIRYHSLEKDANPKVLPYQSGLEYATWLYPEDQLEKDTLIFTEGELDALCCISQGLPAITRTCGAITWKSEFNNYFKDKTVNIIQDCDEPGREGSLKITQELSEIAKEIRIIDLALKEKEDLTDWFVTYGKSKEELERVIANEAKDKSITLEELLNTFKKWLELEETEYIEVILATILSNQLLGDPVWLFVIGASGASKTEILRSFTNIESIYTTSKLTPQTLISGKVLKDFDPSLLPQLDGKTLILKDFTTILSLRAEDKQIIFSDLREAYDGYLEKNFGNIGKRTYYAHFTIIAGVTPVLDKFTAMQQNLGERFLKLRLSEKDTEVKIKKAVNNLDVQTVMREELSSATEKFFAQSFELKEVKIPEKIKDKIVKLAQYTASLRTSVCRDPYNRSVLQYLPEEEVGTRLGIQLAKLGKALAAIRNKEEITESELKILTRVARDTIPKKVTVVMDCLGNQPYGLTTSEIREKTGIENKTCLYALYDLQVLGLVKSKKLEGEGAQGNPLNWKITEKFEKLNIIHLKIK